MAGRADAGRNEPVVRALGAPAAQQGARRPAKRTQQGPARAFRGRRPRRASVASAYPGALACRRKFLRSFPAGFADETYHSWERGYKWEAHRAWQGQLGPKPFATMLEAGRYTEIAQHAVRIESRTNLLFSFEKMALRDAVRDPQGARRFAEGLQAFLHGPGPLEDRFGDWRDAVAGLPRRKTRVLTWPLLTVFGFIAQPRRHMFLKPTVTRKAALAYGFPFHYGSKPDWETYDSLLAFAGAVRRDLADLGPKDMIDLQSFIWVQGSDEY